MSATTIETSEYANSYLTDGFTLRSWLLTTDHKRIALLYLGSITFFFFIGGAAAALIRLQSARAGGHDCIGGNLQQDIHHSRRGDGVVLSDSRRAGDTG